MDDSKNESGLSVRSGYSDYVKVIQRALDQTQSGKGLERHHTNEPFRNQQIVEIGKRLSGSRVAGQLFQAVKKCYESKRLDMNAEISELYGAINYIVAAIITLEDMNREANKKGSTMDGEMHDMRDPSRST